MEKCKSPFSGNLLKIIAAISMTLDHIGIMLFPYSLVFRLFGRIAFPIFAFFIAEGCRHTKNRARYLGTMAVMAFIIQLVYFVAMDSLYMSIFVTFTLAVSLIYLLDFCKNTLVNEGGKTLYKIGATVAFIAAFVGVYFLNVYLEIDYGFFGCITPLFAHLFFGVQGKYAWLDSLPCRLATMALPMLGLPFTLTVPLQWYAFLALPLLLLYNGKRGKYKMKYFFYIFYPAHLVIIYGISYLL